MWDVPSIARAHAEGWCLVTTIDSVPNAKPYYDIVRTEPGLKTDAEAQHFVVERAKSMSAFHLKALKLIAASRLKART